MYICIYMYIYMYIYEPWAPRVLGPKDHANMGPRDH